MCLVLTLSPLQHGQRVVPRPLDAAPGDPGRGVVLGVVDLAPGDEGDVQPRHPAVVPEHAEVRV